LEAWAARLAAWTGKGDDVYVYFDNDAHGHAPHDALRLAERLAAFKRPKSVSSRLSARRLLDRLSVVA